MSGEDIEGDGVNLKVISVGPGWQGIDFGNFDLLSENFLATFLHKREASLFALCGKDALEN